STITQQAAKLLIQRREGIARRGLRAKLREMVLALRLEHRFSKREILALYLNLASYGNQTAGVARASRAYFGVSPAMLTTAQAADPEGDARPRTPARGGRRHRREPRSAPAARRRERRGHRARQRSRGMDCVGRIGQLLRRGTRGRDQRPARAAPAGIRVEAVHVR